MVLVSGGSVDRTSNAPLAQALAPHFTVLNYDRRGRGPSGDTEPYAIEREIEDIEAVIGAAGGNAASSIGWQFQNANGVSLRSGSVAC